MEVWGCQQIWSQKSRTTFIRPHATALRVLSSYQNERCQKSTRCTELVSVAARHSPSTKQLFTSIETCSFLSTHVFIFDATWAHNFKASKYSMRFSLLTLAILLGTVDLVACAAPGTTPDEPEESDTAWIIGGADADIRQFPYFAHGYDCGASLIWYDIALTAAHCGGAFLYQDLYIGSTTFQTVVRKMSCGESNQSFLPVILSCPMSCAELTLRATDRMLSAKRFL